MNVIRMRCPGSCGEFLQGWLDGSEKLISYAIDCFSEMTLVTQPSPDGNAAFQKEHPRAMAMVNRSLEGAGIPLEAAEGLTLHLTSDLPRAKGLASSTADLAVTAAAVAAWAGNHLSAEELTALCTGLEPTDSILHQSLVLMDPLTGEVTRRYDTLPRMQVLVLEGLAAVETGTFRREDHRESRRALRGELETALSLFEKGLEEGDYGKLADACLISARANQYFYPHPGLETLHQTACRYGAYGVNIAHSGSSAGILHDPGVFQLEGFLEEWHRAPAAIHYFPPRLHRIIPGGVIQWDPALKPGPEPGP